MAALAVSSGAGRVALAALAAASWMVVSSWLILLNKQVMVNYGFPYPMTVSGLGMVTSAVLSALVCGPLRLVETKFAMTPGYWFRKMLPVGLFMALTLWLGNLVYMHLTVSFIQMLKAFTPVVTMVCLAVAGLESPSRAMVSAVLLTAVGTAVAAYGELKLSLLGITIMMGSELCEAIRLVITQWLLTGLNAHPIEGLMYLAPAGSVWLLLGAACVEFPKIHATGALAVMKAHPMEFVACAIMGFTVNTLAYATIKLASSLTLKVLGTVKNTLLVVFSVLFLGETVTGVTFVGYTVSLVGFAWYNRIKMAQIAAGPQAGPGGAAKAEQPLPRINPGKGREADDPEVTTRLLQPDMSPRKSKLPGSQV